MDVGAGEPDTVPRSLHSTASGHRAWPSAGLDGETTSYRVVSSALRASQVLIKQPINPHCTGEETEVHRGTGSLRSQREGRGVGHARACEGQGGR